MRGAPQIFQGFTAGVNLIDAPYMLAEKECRDARNVVSTGRGAIRKRDGNAQFAALGAEAASVFPMQTPDALIVQIGTELRTVDAAGNVSAALVSGLNVAPFEFIQASASGGQGPVYGMNGTDTPRQFTGAVWAAWTASTGALPNGRYLRYAQNRVIVAGEVANPSRVYASKIQDPRIFASPDGWAADLDVADGRPITGLGTIGPYVLAFKEGKTWAIYDVDTGANRRLSDSVGCVSHRSIVESPVGTFFLARDGVYRTDGSDIKLVSQRIRPLIERIPPGMRSRAAGVFLDGHYYLAIAGFGETANTLLLDYDVVNDAWWIHTVAANQLVLWQTVNGTLLIGARSGLSRLDSYFVDGLTQDAGANFLAYWSGPFHAFGAPALRKRVRQIHFDGLGVIDVALTKDFQQGTSGSEVLSLVSDPAMFGVDDGTLFGVDEVDPPKPYGGARLVEEAKIYTPGVARTWSVTFGNQTADSFEIDSYTFAIEMRKN